MCIAALEENAKDDLFFWWMDFLCKLYQHIIWCSNFV